MSFHGLSSVPVTSSDDGVQISSTCCDTEYLCFDTQVIQSRGQIWQRSAIFVLWCYISCLCGKQRCRRFMRLSLMSYCSRASSHVHSASDLSVFDEDRTRTQQCAKSIQNISVTLFLVNPDQLECSRTVFKSEEVTMKISIDASIRSYITKHIYFLCALKRKIIIVCMLLLILLHKCIKMHKNVKCIAHKSVFSYNV